jgi:hypothetical protein
VEAEEDLSVVEEGLEDVVGLEESQVVLEGLGEGTASRRGPDQTTATLQKRTNACWAKRMTAATAKGDNERTQQD